MAVRIIQYKTTKVDLVDPVNLQTTRVNGKTK